MKDLLKVIVFGGLFLIPFLPVYVENSFFFPFITGKNFAFRIIIEVVFASWILLSLFDAKYRPKFSWILVGFSALLGVMFFANILGEYAPKSFWSNFERMDGYVTLVHLFLYVVVAGSVMTTQKLWSYFFHLSVAVALFVALYGLAQFTGMIDGGRARVDSLLGNAAYMAVYMLFNIFMTLWLFVRSKSNVTRIIYGLIGIILVYTLLQTGTRGTFLGFVGGISVAVGYIALFGRKYPELRKVAIGGCIVVVLAVGGFLAIKDSDYVQNSLALSRISNIDLAKDLVVRGTIWSMAFEGVKERPLLGWGQGNFNYVFNKNFDPSLYNAESWFDRTHNIFLDWLIAGGVLGLLAYFSIFFAALYYLFWLPIFKKDQSFNVLERAVLIGLLAGYLIHNLVVFDNIISYIFYGAILALIHSRVGKKIEKIETYKVSQKMIFQFFVPIIILVAGASIYFVNASGIKAAGGIIDGLRADTIVKRTDTLLEAIGQNSFGTQEIVEQLAQQAMNIVRNPNIPEADKRYIIDKTQIELVKMVEEKPGDARLHNFLESFYRSIGAFPQAQEQAVLARKFSPNKQAIILEQGVIEVQMGNQDAALEYFKTAYELDVSYTLPMVLYSASLILDGNTEQALELIGDENFDIFSLNEYALSAVNKNGNRDLLTKMFVSRIEQRPGNAQNYASLSFLYYELGDFEKSIEILTNASNTVPTFRESAGCFIGNLEKGNPPNEGCQ